MVTDCSQGFGIADGRHDCRAQGQTACKWLAVLFAYRLTRYISTTWAASSVVEHLTFNQGVAGSIPARPTNGIKIFRISPLRLPPVIILTAAEYLALQPGSDWQPRWPSKLPTERERSVCARRHAHGEDLAFVDPRHGLGDLAHDHAIASCRRASPWRAARRCFPWRWRSACRSGHGERPAACSGGLIYQGNERDNIPARACREQAHGIDRIEDHVPGAGVYPGSHPPQAGLTPGSRVEWCERGDEVLVRRASKYSSLDIHKAVISAPPARRRVEDMDEGIQSHLRRTHARG